VSVWGIELKWYHLPVLFLVLLLIACDSNICSNELKNEAVSSDGKYVASIFERNCGATTPFVQVVSLRLSNMKFDPENHDEWVFTIHGKSNVEVDWTDVDRLQVSYSSTGDEPTKRTNWQDVVISYK
jgi:hypothetical protein